MAASPSLSKERFRIFSETGLEPMVEVVCKNRGGGFLKNNLMAKESPTSFLR